MVERFYRNSDHPQKQFLKNFKVLIRSFIVEESQIGETVI